MAQVISRAKASDYVLLFEYSSNDTRIAIYEDPVIAWAINDATGSETPIIPGGFPPGPATPNPSTKPLWANLSSATLKPQTLCVIVPNVWRGVFPDFLTWLTQNYTVRLRGQYLIAPVLVAQFKEWARQQPRAAY